MLIADMIEEIEHGEYDERLIDLYVDKELLANRKLRYLNLLKMYKSLFGEHDVRMFSSPGRSEICGNHTDHQGGKVLAAAVNLDIIAVASANDTGKINIFTDGKQLNQIDLYSVYDKSSQGKTSESLVYGVAARLKDLGYSTGGFNVCITSDVLVGSGLSSSAAFENLIGVIISSLYNDGTIDPITIAKVSQYAEIEYYGKPCGLMDQLASCIGGVVKIDFRSKENPEVENMEMDLTGYNSCLCIVNTKGTHAGLTDEYAAITKEMKSVASYFDKNLLSEITNEQFFNNIADIRAKIGDRAVLRAMHYFNENDRVNLCADALYKRDFSCFKDTIKASGNSSFKYLQNVFSNKSSCEQGISIGLALSEKILSDHGVCRVHGGGFAGTIQSFVDLDYIHEYKRQIEAVFGEGSCLALQIRKTGAVELKK